MQSDELPWVCCVDGWLKLMKGRVLWVASVDGWLDLIKGHVLWVG